MTTTGSDNKLLLLLWILLWLTLLLLWLLKLLLLGSLHHILFRLSLYLNNLSILSLNQVLLLLRIGTLLLLTFLEQHMLLSTLGCLHNKMLLTSFGISDDNVLSCTSLQKLLEGASF